MSNILIFLAACIIGALETTPLPGQFTLLLLLSILISLVSYMIGDLNAPDSV